MAYADFGAPRDTTKVVLDFAPRAMPRKAAEPRAEDKNFELAPA